MTAWLLRRLLVAFAIVFAVATLSFIAVQLAPGSPFLPPDDRPVDRALVARLNARYGLDQPLPIRYARYLDAVAHGYFGMSFSRQRPVSQVIASALPNTVVLAGAALLIDFILGVALGVYQAARAGRRVDAVLTGGSLFLYSLPTFWLGLVLLLTVGPWLHLPGGGITDDAIYGALSLGGRILDRLRHLALPALTLGLVGAGGTARFQRAALLEVLHQDYIRTARAKGLTEGAVLRRHALRDALLPTITLLGLSLPFLLTGAVLVETVFAWPGLGKLAADAIGARDYPVVVATTILASTAVVLGNLLADILSVVADPRLRLAA